MGADESDKLAPSGPGEEKAHGPGLNARQQEIAAELRYLHPALGRLYERGVGLLGELDDPSARLLLAHVGRELSRGSRDALLEEEDFELPKSKVNAVPDDETHRLDIAKVLQRHPYDPRVTKWHQVHQDLQSWVHFRTPLPDASEVRQGFEALETILHSRIGPYFSGRAELDDFLAIDDPSEGNVDELYDYLLRPAQRRDFFRELQNPRWVGPLAKAGAFSEPPEWTGSEEDGWRPRTWPEGRYLARVASTAPEIVVNVVEQVSTDLENPAVWDILTSAAVRIPPSDAAVIVPKFCKALQLRTGRYFAANLAELVEHLAADEPDAAFQLVEYLLFVPSSAEAEGYDEDSHLPMDGRWMLPRIDWRSGEAVFDNAVLALQSVDRQRTLALLLSKLGRVAALSQETDPTVMFWRPDRFDIESSAERPDTPERLFDEAIRVLRESGARDAEHARKSLALLDELPENLGRRLRYILLAEAGEFLPSQVDAALASEELVQPPGTAREVALFLREQFGSGSSEARQAFCEAVHEGPPPSEMENRWLAEVDRTRERALKDARQSWQRKRLRWFRGEIPEALEGLAESVGLAPGETPTVRERELAEVGFYSQGVSWVGPQSPVDADELAAMTPEEIVQALANETSASRTADELDVHGLGDALARLASSDAEKVLAAANIAAKEGLAVQSLRGFVEGIRKTLAQDRAVNWRQTLCFASAAVETVSGEVGDEVVRLAAAVALLLKSGLSEDLVPPEESPDIWDLLSSMSQIEGLWEETTQRSPDGFYGVLSLALNHPAGKLTSAVCSGILWQFRALTPDGAQLDAPAPEARAVISTEAIPILEQALGHDGQARIAVEAMLGRSLPQLYHLAPDWLAERAEMLLEPGCEEPLEHPAWPSFLWHYGYEVSLFDAYRPYYLLSARSARRFAAPDEDGSGRSIADHLATHLLPAVLQGAVSIGDEDRLIEIAFAGLPAPARSHAYWAVFRAWSDSDEEPPPNFVARLLSFWRWRVEQLGLGEVDGIREEAQGLAWLMRTPYLPDPAVAELGSRTVDLAEGDVRLNSLWGRLGELAEVDPVAVSRIVVRAVDAELQADHSLVSVEDGVPLMRGLLSDADAETRERLERTVHRLGEAGFEEFGQLLDVAE